MLLYYFMKVEIWLKYFKYSLYCFYLIDYLVFVIVKNFDMCYIYVY